MTREQIASVVTALGDILAVLKDADPADKAEIYSSLACDLSTSQASASSAPRRTSARLPIGFSTVSEGGLHPNPNVCWQVFSQLRAGHERGADRWIPWTRPAA
jgi:hypothetical protein